MTNIIAQISSHLIYWTLGLLYSQNLTDSQEGRSASLRISPTHFVLEPCTSRISSLSRPSSLDNLSRETKKKRRRRRRHTEDSCRRLFCPVLRLPCRKLNIRSRDDGPGIIRCLSCWDKNSGTGLQAAHMRVISLNTDSRRMS